MAFEARTGATERTRWLAASAVCLVPALGAAAVQVCMVLAVLAFDLASDAFTLTRDVCNMALAFALSAARHALRHLRNALSGGGAHRKTRRNDEPQHRRRVVPTAAAQHVAESLDSSFMAEFAAAQHESLQTAHERIRAHVAQLAAVGASHPARYAPRRFFDADAHKLLHRVRTILRWHAVATAAETPLPAPAFASVILEPLESLEARAALPAAARLCWVVAAWTARRAAAQRSAALPSTDAPASALPRGAWESVVEPTVRVAVELAAKGAFASAPGADAALYDLAEASRRVLLAAYHIREEGRREWRRRGHAPPPDAAPWTLAAHLAQTCAPSAALDAGESSSGHAWATACSAAFAGSCTAVGDLADAVLDARLREHATLSTAPLPPRDAPQEALYRVLATAFDRSAMWMGDTDLFEPGEVEYCSELAAEVAVVALEAAASAAVAPLATHTAVRAAFQAVVKVADSALGHNTTATRSSNALFESTVWRSARDEVVCDDPVAFAIARAAFVQLLCVAALPQNAPNETNRVDAALGPSSTLASLPSDLLLDVSTQQASVEHAARDLLASPLRSFVQRRGTDLAARGARGCNFAAGGGPWLPPSPRDLALAGLQRTAAVISALAAFFSLVGVVPLWGALPPAFARFVSVQSVAGAQLGAAVPEQASSLVPLAAAMLAVNVLRYLSLLRFTLLDPYASPATSSRIMATRLFDVADLVLVLAPLAMLPTAQVATAVAGGAAQAPVAVSVTPGPLFPSLRSLYAGKLVLAAAWAFLTAWHARERTSAVVRSADPRERLVPLLALFAANAALALLLPKTASAPALAAAAAAIVPAAAVAAIVGRSIEASGTIAFAMVWLLVLVDFLLDLAAGVAVLDSVALSLVLGYKLYAAVARWLADADALNDIAALEGPQLAVSTEPLAIERVPCGYIPLQAVASDDETDQGDGADETRTLLDDRARKLPTASVPSTRGDSLAREATVAIFGARYAGVWRWRDMGLGVAAALTVIALLLCAAVVWWSGIAMLAERHSDGTGASAQLASLLEEVVAEALRPRACTASDTTTGDLVCQSNANELADTAPQLVRYVVAAVAFVLVGAAVVMVRTRKGFRAAAGVAAAALLSTAATPLTAADWATAVTSSSIVAPLGSTDLVALSAGALCTASIVALCTAVSAPADHGPAHGRAVGILATLSECLAVLATLCALTLAPPEINPPLGLLAALAHAVAWAMRHMGHSRVAVVAPGLPIDDPNSWIPPWAQRAISGSTVVALVRAGTSARSDRCRWAVFHIVVAVAASGTTSLYPILTTPAQASGLVRGGAAALVTLLCAAPHLLSAALALRLHAIILA